MLRKRLRGWSHQWRNGTVLGATACERRDPSAALACLCGSELGFPSSHSDGYDFQSNPASRATYPAPASALPDEVSRLVPDIVVYDEAEPVVRDSDIVSSATSTCEPIILGKWLQTGTHVDLVGSYRADMRESDDGAIRRGRLFVDTLMSTIDVSGDVTAPLANGVVERDDIVALGDVLQAKVSGRKTDGDITIFKSGGGAYQDLAVARYIYDRSTN